MSETVQAILRMTQHYLFDLICQQIQFFCITTHAAVGLWANCSFPRFWSWVLVVVPCSHAALFLNFYYGAYLKSAAHKKSKVLQNGNHKAALSNGTSKVVSANGKSASNGTHVTSLTNGKHSVTIANGNSHVFSNGLSNQTARKDKSA